MRFKKVYLEITNICNLKCPFCIGNTREKKYLSFDEFKIILNKLSGYTSYLYFHILGEPLMHPNVNEFINYAKENNFNINITTNGYLLNKIKDNKNVRQINISLHSFNENNGVTLNDYLANIFDSVDELIKNKTYISLRLWVKNEHNEKMVEFINNRYKVEINLDNYFKINDYLFINPFHEFIWPDLNNNYYEEEGTCYALKDHIGILSNGTIVPCCLDTKGIIALGNIFEDDLKEILENERIKNMLNNFKNNKKCEELCRHCKFLNKEGEKHE